MRPPLREGPVRLLLVVLATGGHEDGDDSGDLLWRGRTADKAYCPGHSGMLPCFLGGSETRLLRRANKALMTLERVNDGGITEST